MVGSPPSSREASPLRKDDRTEAVKVDNPGETRTSRRRQGLPPEYGLLEDPERHVKAHPSTTMTNTADPATFTFQQPKEPPKFHGSACEDSQEWLDRFERVASYNKWSEEDKLRNVFFSLEDSARTWYENQETSLTTWDIFKRRLASTFPHAHRKEQAEAMLETRQQHPNEPVTVFVEEMQKIFRHVDDDMTEEKKLQYLMRAVKEQLFVGLIRNPPKTVAEFVTEAATIEKTLDLRARQYNRGLPAVSSGNVDFDTPDAHSLRATIRTIIREELQKLLPAASPHVAPLTSVIRDELHQALGTAFPTQTVLQPVPQPAVMTYADAIRSQMPLVTRTDTYTPSPPPQPYTPLSRRPLQSRPMAYQEATAKKADLWRTPNRRPLCFHCGEAGHVLRTCPYRRMGLRGFSVNAPRPLPGQRPHEIEAYLREMEGQAQPRPRSPSPQSRRTQSPHSARFYGTGERSPSPRQGN